MSLSIAFAALLGGVITWWLLVRQLTSKSWQTNTVDNAYAGRMAQQPSARIGLWVFLGVITSLFALFIAAYFIRMGHGHGAGQGIYDWRTVAKPPILWLNTLILFVSSLVMQLARQAVTRQQAMLVRRSLIAGGLLTMLFLAGQLAAWQQLHTPDMPWSNPALAFFYLLTAVHGLHLAGGLVVWGRTLARLWTPGLELIDVRLSVELCSLYWHYLFIVWLVLFTLLLYT